MRLWIVLLRLCACALAFTPHDENTDDLKPFDPDTGEALLRRGRLNRQIFSRSGVSSLRSPTSARFSASHLLLVENAAALSQFLSSVRIVALRAPLFHLRRSHFLVARLNLLRCEISSSIRKPSAGYGVRRCAREQITFDRRLRMLAELKCRCPIAVSSKPGASFAAISPTRTARRKCSAVLTIARAARMAV